MITWRAVGSAARNPNLAERSTIGSTVPRKLTTPRTKLGDLGSAVAFVQPRISRTDIISTQNSRVPMRKAISSHARAKSVGRWSGLLSVSVILISLLLHKVVRNQWQLRASQPPPHRRRELTR